MGTKLRDLVNDVEGQAIVRRGMEAVQRQQAEQKLKAIQQENLQGPEGVTKSAEEKGVFECSLGASILTRKLPVVVDTGASHSIVSYRTIRKLKLKSLMRPSKKAFITAAGELTFPVGEIAALPLTIGEATVNINCMVVSKACFNVLLGLDMMKPLGAIIDLQQDVFTFTDNRTSQRVRVALQYGKVSKTSSDVKLATQVHSVRMLKPIPSERGPLTGQTFFPGLDTLSPPTESALQDHRMTPSMKMSNRLKTRLQLKTKKVKQEKPFPEGAEINSERTPEQRQQVLDILVQFKDVFVSDSPILPCTDLEEHRIDTGDAPPIYIPPYRCSQAEEEVIQKEVDEMLALGIIRESRSPWGASAVLVTKKTGDWRLCIDYRALNRVTKKESYPIPLIDDMLNAVGSSSWFSLIDLRSA